MSLNGTARWAAAMWAGIACLQCSKKSAEPEITPPPYTEYFPTGIGSEWRYEITLTHGDPADGQPPSRIDTLTVTVEDTVRMSSTGELAWVWHFDPIYPHDFTFSYRYYYVTRTQVNNPGAQADTIRFYSGTAATQPAWMYIGPVAYLDGWQCAECRRCCDQVIVTRMETVSVPAGVFDSTFVAAGIIGWFEGWHTFKTFLKPGVGVVGISERSRHYMDGSGGGSDVSVNWYLLSYHIEEP